MNELEDLIRMAHIVSKPYLIAVWVLSLLLLISLSANVYLATVENIITFDADADNQSEITQKIAR